VENGRDRNESESSCDKSAAGPCLRRLWDVILCRNVLWISKVDRRYPVFYKYDDTLTLSGFRLVRQTEIDVDDVDNDWIYWFYEE